MQHEYSHDHLVQVHVLEIAKLAEKWEILFDDINLSIPKHDTHIDSINSHVFTMTK